MNICPYCKKPADAAMLTVGGVILHADCVIRMLNELLDPDWEKGKEPSKTVGYLRGGGMK